MPRYVVLKELPQFQQPGEIVDLHEDAGDVFMAIDAVRKATVADDHKTIEQRLRPRADYRRRDLRVDA